MKKPQGITEGASAELLGKLIRQCCGILEMIAEQLPLFLPGMLLGVSVISHRTHHTNSMSVISILKIRGGRCNLAFFGLPTPGISYYY
jgi:hypothetical protein